MGYPVWEIFTRPLTWQPTRDWMSLRVGIDANQESPWNMSTLFLSNFRRSSSNSSSASWSSSILDSSASRKETAAVWALISSWGHKVLSDLLRTISRLSMIPVLEQPQVLNSVPSGYLLLSFYIAKMRKFSRWCCLRPEDTHRIIKNFPYWWCNTNISIHINLFKTTYNLPPWIVIFQSDISINHRYTFLISLTLHSLMYWTILPLNIVPSPSSNLHHKELSPSLQQWPLRMMQKNPPFILCHSFYSLSWFSLFHN